MTNPKYMYIKYVSLFLPTATRVLKLNINIK